MANPRIAAELAAKRGDAADVLAHLGPGDDVIVGVGNGEPVTVVDAIEEAARSGVFAGEAVRMHQMLPLHPRDYPHGRVDGLRHVSWFLSETIREAFGNGHCDLIPNNFSEVPALLRASTKRSLMVSAASPPDEHGFFSLGSQAEYAAALIGEVPTFLEANAGMPRTSGENQIHVRDVVGWCEADYPLVEVPPAAPSELDRRIASLVAERIGDGATLQVGIGSVPDMVLSMLGDRRDLGVHSEVFGEGFVDLIEAGVITGARKSTHRHKAITTAGIGTQRLYDFVAGNAGVEFWPVDYTNDPRVIGRERRMTAINATMEVDFLGQCASESIGSDYWSSSGGQADFARGALFAEEGQSFTVLHSTAHGGEISRIVSRLRPGAAVTTPKNVVDKVATEHGVAELRGVPIRERARRLIAIAEPRFREDLEREAREIGYL